MFHIREIVEPVAPTELAVASKLALVWRIATWPLRVLAARQAMAQLGAMSDRELADVGLRRQDLRDATALSLGEDPTAVLAARAAERWRGRRWAARRENLGTPLAPRSGEREIKYLAPRGHVGPASSSGHSPPELEYINVPCGDGLRPPLRFAPSGDNSGPIANKPEPRGAVKARTAPRRFGKFSKCRRSASIRFPEPPDCGAG